MTNKVTLASIKAAADKKFGHTEIDLEDGMVVVLVNPLRLDKESRKVLTSMSDSMKDGDTEMFDALAEALMAAAQTTAQGEALVAALDGDAAVALTVFEQYMDQVELGEASPSQN